jgi:hypothetical protein
LDVERQLSANQPINGKGSENAGTISLSPLVGLVSGSSTPGRNDVVGTPPNLARIDTTTPSPSTFDGGDDGRLSLDSRCQLSANLQISGGGSDGAVYIDGVSGGSE